MVPGKGHAMSTLPVYVPVGLRDIIRHSLAVVVLIFGARGAPRTLRQRELTQEHWLSDNEVQQGMPAAQALPGPLAMQVGIYVSYLRGGFWAPSP